MEYDEFMFPLAGKLARSCSSRDVKLQNLETTPFAFSLPFELRAVIVSLSWYFIYFHVKQFH
jgi:hypothetical protein